MIFVHSLYLLFIIIIGNINDLQLENKGLTRAIERKQTIVEVRTEMHLETKGAFINDSEQKVIGTQDLKNEKQDKSKTRIIWRVTAVQPTKRTMVSFVTIYSRISEDQLIVSCSAFV